MMDELFIVVTIREGEKPYMQSMQDSQVAQYIKELPQTKKVYNIYGINPNGILTQYVPIYDGHIRIVKASEVTDIYDERRKKYVSQMVSRDSITPEMLINRNSHD